MTGDWERGRAVTGIILAGGESSRLREPGRDDIDKGLLPLGEARLVEWVNGALAQVCREVICITDNPEYQRLGLRCTGDLIRRSARNALAGIHAGLRAASNPYALVVACDMPFIRVPLLRYLAGMARGKDIVIPRVEGYLQPLCAVYSQVCLPDIEEQLAADNYRIFDFFPRVRVQTVEEAAVRRFDPELHSFFNINTPADYGTARQLARTIART